MDILFAKLHYAVHHKVENVAVIEVCKKAIWLGRIVPDLGIKSKMP